MNLVLNLYRLIFLLLALALWEGVARLGWVQEFVMSRPTRVFAWLGDALVTGFFWINVGVTLRETLLGLLIGCLLGVASGFALAHWPKAFRLLEPACPASRLPLSFWCGSASAKDPRSRWRHRWSTS